MQTTFLRKIALGAMAVAACAALSPAHAEDDEAAKPAAEGDGASQELGEADAASAKPEKFFYPLVRCRLIEGCGVQVMKPGTEAWVDGKEGRYYPLGSTFRVTAPEKGNLRAEFAFGDKSVVRATNAVEFATEAIAIGEAARTVVLKRGLLSIELPRSLRDGLFAVKAPFFACANLAGESTFDYSPTGDGDEVVVRCVTGSMMLEGRHYKIERMGAANQIRIRTTGDDLFTSLRGESGDCEVSLDQGLVQEKNFETGDVKDVPKTLKFSLSPKCAIKIFRAKSPSGRLIVSTMTFNSTGEMMNRCAFAENLSTVNSGELVVMEAIPDADKEKTKKSKSDAEAEAVETVDVGMDAAKSEDADDKKADDKKGSDDSDI